MRKWLASVFRRWADRLDPPPVWIFETDSTSIGANVTWRLDEFRL